MSPLPSAARPQMLILIIIIHKNFICQKKIYSFILWYVATAEGETLLRYLNIQYLKIVSRITGKVEMNKKIKSRLSGNPKCLNKASIITSKTWGERKPTNISVNKIIKKA